MSNENIFVDGMVPKNVTRNGSNGPWTEPHIWIPNVDQLYAWMCANRKPDGSMSIILRSFADKRQDARGNEKLMAVLDTFVPQPQGGQQQQYQQAQHQNYGQAPHAMQNANTQYQPQQQVPQQPQMPQQNYGQPPAPPQQNYGQYPQMPANQIGYQVPINNGIEDSISF